MDDYVDQGRREDGRGPRQIQKAGPIIQIVQGGSGGTPPENVEVLHALSVFWGLLRLLFVHAYSTYIYLQVAVFV